MKEDELAEGIWHAVHAAGSVTDESAAALTALARSLDHLHEKALVVERIVAAVRERVVLVCDLHQRLVSHLPAHLAAELEDTTGDLRAKIGIAAGSLRRWRLSGLSCTDEAKRAAAEMISVRNAILLALKAAEDLLVSSAGDESPAGRFDESCH